MSAKHYRFTDTMTFTIDVEKKTILIMGSYKYEDLVKAKDGVLKDYEGYEILNENQCPAPDAEKQET